MPMSMLFVPINMCSLSCNHEGCCQQCWLRSEHVGFYMAMLSEKDACRSPIVQRCCPRAEQSSGYSAIDGMGDRLAALAGIPCPMLSTTCTAPPFEVEGWPRRASAARYKPPHQHRCHVDAYMDPSTLALALEHASLLSHALSLACPPALQKNSSAQQFRFGLAAKV